jgi:phosphoribosylformylglycinamidine synthase
MASCHEQLCSFGLEDDANKIIAIDTESCFNVLASELSAIQKDRLEWLLAETFEKSQLQMEQSFFDSSSKDVNGTVWKVEFGPRMTFTSAFSSNACSICQACDIPVDRLELSKRYRFVSTTALSNATVSVLKAMLHDRMTEEEYTEALATFDNGAQPEPVVTVPIMEHGRAALEQINEQRGLGFDDFDLDYYTKLFKVRVLWLFGCLILTLAVGILHLITAIP